jgi:pimeloyl-ACP methyl ester carboxylesterase
MPSVLLLHGIWMRAAVTGRLAARLRAAGYAVHCFDYASIQSTFAEHHERLDRLVESVEGALHIVGHSLGGVLALDYLNHCPSHAARIERVVCLGSPLNGSALAQRLKRVRLDTLGLGFARRVLVDGLPPWTGPQAVGVIAGEISFGLSLLLGPLPRPNDGTVAVAETRLPGITDHVSVRASHTALLFSERAAALTVNFLREGRFARAGETGYRS